MTGLLAVTVLLVVGFIGFVAIAAPTLLIGEGVRSKAEERERRMEVER